MANKNLANATTVVSILPDDYILISTGGSVRKISLEDFQQAIADNDQLLREVAWGVTIKQNASSQSWAHVGNQTMKQEFLDTIGRWLVTNSGKGAKLATSDSSIFADGTALNEALGHVMFRSTVPLYYLVKTNATTGIPTIWWSMEPIGGHVIMPQCFGAYKASMSGSALVSRSGVAPAGSKTITAFWNAAQVNGEHFGLINYDHQKLMIMLNLMQFANPNCQVNIGYGIGGSTSKSLWSAAASLLTGATKSLGDGCGKIDITVSDGAVTGDDCSRVSLFGIEDAWNWQWEMTQGIYFGNSGNSGQNGTEAFIYSGNRLPSAAELASHPNGDYRQLTRNTSSGYVQEMLLGEFFDILCKTIGGGSTSYWGDYNYNNATGGLCLWGGYANSGAYSGLGYASSDNAWSRSDALIGSRLAYYGDIEEMSGAELVTAA